MIYKYNFFCEMHVDILLILNENYKNNCEIYNTLKIQKLLFYYYNFIKNIAKQKFIRL